MVIKINTFTKINNSLCKIPSALAGLALAIASLGLCWDNVANLQGKGQMFGSILASCIIVPLFFKFLLNPRLLKQDLQHPIIGSLTPTMTMAMMVIANYIATYYLKVGQLISFLAIILHCYFLASFIFYRRKNFQLSHVLASWFIPPVGLVLAVITYPGGLNTDFAEKLVSFAFISYAILLPIVLYRLFFLRKLVDAEKPFIVILATPASLLLVCYFAINSQPNYLFVCGLLLLAILMTIAVYFVFIKLLQLPFMPAYSAFTFPLVVGAMALFKTSHFLLQEGADMQLVNVVAQLANIELIIATLMVFYVAIRYILHFLPRNKNLINPQCNIED